MSTSPPEPPDRPRDAPRGGGNGPAPPGQGGRGSPPSIDPPPPFWGHWGRIYLLVAGLLAVEAIVFWWLGRWAS